MPTLREYAPTNDKTGFFIRANVGRSHPVTLQVTRTAERVFEDIGYSGGNSVPTKLVWTMYDVDLVYTESSVTSSTPKHSFDTFSDTVTGSSLTEETRDELIRYFQEYSGPRQDRVNELLDELHTEAAGSSIEPYDSSEPAQVVRAVLRKHSSKTEAEIDRIMTTIGERGYRSLLTFQQRATDIVDITVIDESKLSYQFALLSTTVHDLTTAGKDGNSSTYDYRIQYSNDKISPIYVRDGQVQSVQGSLSDLSEARLSEARQIARKFTPVKIDRGDIRSTFDAPAVSELDIPNRAFIEGDPCNPDLLAGVVDRVSGSGNPLVELENGHLLLKSGNEGDVYLIEQLSSKWGRVVCELTQSRGTERAPDGTTPLPECQILTNTEIEQELVDAARSYHENHSEIVTAQVSDGNLEYGTRALLADDSEGTRCGLRVGTSLDDAVVIEVLAHPDELGKVVNYGAPGICHHLVLTNDEVTWETAVSPEYEGLIQGSRETLLTHQVDVLQSMKATLDAHTGLETTNLIRAVVRSGELEQGITHPSDVWEDSVLLEDLFAEFNTESATNQKRCTGIVDFFHETGGYGFIETDACEEDVFYHMDDIGGPDVTEGDQLKFNIYRAEKGPRAKDMERI